MSRMLKMGVVHGLSALAVLLLVLGADAPGQAGGDPQATGCRRPTAEELDRADKEAVRAGAVRLNRLGLGRVNAERRKRGLPELAEREVGVAPVGSEVVPGADATALQVLPTQVDNSTLQYFPPIRSQGSLGSCA